MEYSTTQMIKIDYENNKSNLRLADNFQLNGTSQRQGFVISVIGQEGIGKSRFIRTATDILFKVGLSDDQGIRTTTGIQYGMVQFENYNVHVFDTEGFSSQEDTTKIKKILKNQKNLSDQEIDKLSENLNKESSKKICLLSTSLCDHVFLLCKLDNNFHEKKNITSIYDKFLLQKLWFIGRIPKYSAKKEENFRKKIKETFFNDQEITLEQIPLIVLPEFDDEDSPSDEYQTKVKTFFQERMSDLIINQRMKALEDIKMELNTSIDLLQFFETDWKAEDLQLRTQVDIHYKKKYYGIEIIINHIEIVKLIKDALKIFKEIQKQFKNFNISAFSGLSGEYKTSKNISNVTGIGAGIAGLASGPIGWLALAFTGASIGCHLYVLSQNMDIQKEAQKIKLKLKGAGQKITKLKEVFENLNKYQEKDLDVVLIKCIYQSMDTYQNFLNIDPQKFRAAYIENLTKVAKAQFDKKYLQLIETKEIISSLNFTLGIKIGTTSTLAGCTAIRGCTLLNNFVKYTNFLKVLSAVTIIMDGIELFSVDQSLQEKEMEFKKQYQDLGKFITDINDQIEELELIVS